MSEWSKEHAWKVCIRKRIEGSNPSLSARHKKAPTRGLFMSGRKLRSDSILWFDKLRQQFGPL